MGDVRTSDTPLPKPDTDQAMKRQEIARRARISLESSIGFAGACGTATSLGASISLAKRWSRSMISPMVGSWSPWPRERWRVCWAISRHIFADNPISSSITPRRSIRTSRFPRRETESTVQRLLHRLHRRMNAQQHMRWSPRGAHLMLKVRTATANGTLERDHAVAERWARRPFLRAA